MLVPLSVILDGIDQYRPESHVEDETLSFSCVNIFPTWQRSLDHSQLYIGRLSQIFAADWHDSESCCIAVRDRISDADETPERMKNIIVLNSNCDVLDVFSTVQDIFSRIVEWNERMKDYLIQNRPIQDILCLSEDIIGNFITISDSSLGLVAYTAGLDVDCPTTKALIKNGYHNEESVALFKKYGLPERWNSQSDIYINESRQASPYPNVCKVVRYNNVYFAHVIMICNVRPPSRCIVDLFRMLLNHLMICFERQWHDESSTLHVYDSLITSLIDDEEISNEIIAERAQYSGLPMSADYCFLKASPESSMGVMLQRMAQDIMSHIPESKVTIYRGSLAILLVKQQKGKEWFAQIQPTLEMFMERYSSRCGISNPFSSLLELRYAYHQADVALKYGSRQSLLPFSGQAKLNYLRLYSYENYYPCYLMCGDPERAKLASTTKASVALRKLYHHDQQHSSNNLELLFVYLSNERKATETAKIMHMHRNNVIYHINRISEMIEMDLDDSTVRFRLLLAYEIFSPTEEYLT